MTIPQEITTTLAGTLPYMLRAKMRGFFRRSLYRYIIAAAFIACALNLKTSNSLVNIVFLKDWLLYTLAICSLALILILVSAVVQSRKQLPWQVSFKEDSITISHADDFDTKTWDWVLHVEESDTSFVFIVQEATRLELFISRKKLSQDEYQIISNWLVRHGKTGTA